MPSKTTVLALALVVLLSGCSMIPGGGGGSQTTTVEPPDAHELTFGSDAGGHAYGATVTVRKDGETVFSESIESDGDGFYANLTRLDESGPYTVTVNTTLPATGGGNMSEQFTVDGTLGNATIIRLTYQEIYHSTLRLPRQQLEHPLGGYSSYRNENQRPAELTLDVRVWHRGERVVSDSITIDNNDNHNKLTNLEETGIYRVAVQEPDGEWVSNVVAADSRDTVVRIIVDHNGGVRKIEAIPPWPYERR